MLSTTELLVEHIISGIMALVWLWLLVFSFVPLDLYMFDMMSNYWPLVVLVLFAIAYPLGMIVDNLADNILERSTKKIKRAEISDPYISVSILNFKLKDDFIKSWFNYVRFKIRILRSCMLNFLFIGVFGFLFCLFNQLPYGFIFLGVGVLLSLLSFFMWKQNLHKTYANVENWRKLIKS